MKKVGIMGGTFNPVHCAHLVMAQAACDQYGLEEVLFMPSKNPPHKRREEIVPEDHRKRMVQFAIDAMPQFSFSNFELRREGTTYTCDTLRLLKEQHPDWELYFILGGDSLEDFTGWYKPAEILKLCTVLAVPREDMGYRETVKRCGEIGRELSGKMFPVHMKRMRISSRMIRKKIRNGELPDGLCPDKVCRYIELHGLYGMPVYTYPPGVLEGGGMSGDLFHSLASTLRPKRFRHTLGVAHTAAMLAACHGADVKRAELAGMLHDCAKYLTGSEMIQQCERNGLAMSPVERENTALLHGKLGAWLAGTRYGIRDAEILSAIEYHTTGRPAMGLLEKILYIADYIEPDRDMDCVPYPLRDVRKACFLDLEEGLFQILANTIQYLNGKDGVAIDEMTWKTYEFYKDRRNG